MNIVRNLPKAEPNYYMSQPTAKQWQEKMLHDRIEIPKRDKAAVAKNVATRDAGKAVDAVEISQEAYALQARKNDVTVKFGDNEIPVTKVATEKSFILHFNNSAILNRIAEKGSLEINGKEFLLSDEIKHRLLTADETARKMREKSFLQSVMQHDAAVIRQQSDALREMSAKQSRTMGTASRIMHGKKVSPADEKELMETNPELYSMAKSAAQLAKHKKHDANDDRVSRENDAARAEEAEPKDYDIPEIGGQRYETQMIALLDGDTFQVQSIEIAAAE